MPYIENTSKAGRKLQHLEIVKKEWNGIFNAQTI